MDENPSILSHISIGTNDFEHVAAFYDKVLGALGCKRIMEHAGAVAYGRKFPEFWVQKPVDGDAASSGNGTHFAFMAFSRAQVQALYDAAIEAGATPDGLPGPRSDYGSPYYGCFVRDLNGHKIEATFWDAG